MKRDASVIRQILDTAELFSPQKFDWLRDEIARIQNLLENTLGVEAEGRQKLEASLKDLQSRPKDYIQKLKKISVYRRLSLEPLTWRNDDGFPKLAVFALTSPLFSLTIKFEGNADSHKSEGYSYFESRFLGGDIGTVHFSHNIEPILPRKIEHCYKDVLRFLIKKFIEKYRYQYQMRTKGIITKLTCRFEGLIPFKIKEEIKKARELFGDNIFIVAELKNFTLNEIIPLPKEDPLIVGYDSDTDPNSLWLISDFDITSVEEAMVFHSKI